MEKKIAIRIAKQKIKQFQKELLIWEKKGSRGVDEVKDINEAIMEQVLKIDSLNNN